MNRCDACGSSKVYIAKGNAFFCRECDPEIQEEIDRLREAGKPVNVLHIAKRRFREMNCDRRFTIRDIPNDLWTRAQHRAVDEGKSLRDLIFDAVEIYLSKSNE